MTTAKIQLKTKERHEKVSLDIFLFMSKVSVNWNQSKINVTLVCHAAHVNKVERILPSNIFVEA